MQAIIEAKEREKRTYVNSPVVSLKCVIKYTPSGAAQNVTKNFAPKNFHQKISTKKYTPKNINKKEYMGNNLKIRGV